jgi:hypothetical protein
VADLLDEQHAQVGLALLVANPALGAAKVFDGKVPDPTPTLPYVIVYTIVEWTRDGIGTALSAAQVTVTTTYTCHCVGGSAEAARWVGMQVRSSLLNARPVIAGRNCGPIKQFETSPPQRDETTGHLIMDAISTYGFVSTG